MTERDCKDLTWLIIALLLIIVSSSGCVSPAAPTGPSLVVAPVPCNLVGDLLCQQPAPVLDPLPVYLPPPTCIINCPNPSLPGGSSVTLPHPRRVS